MIVKHSLTIRGHATSISVEDLFWTELSAIAGSREMTLAGLVSTIDAERDPKTNLSSAIRLFVLRQVIDERDAFSCQKSNGLETPGSAS